MMAPFCSSDGRVDGHNKWLSPEPVAETRNVGGRLRSFELQAMRHQSEKIEKRGVTEGSRLKVALGVSTPLAPREPFAIKTK